MEGGKTFNRWLIVVGALLIQVSLGAIYIYSVFKPGLKARFPDWSNTDLALPSMLVLLFFGLATIFAGRIQDKIGPRYVAMTGAVMLGLGLLLASFSNSLFMFTLGFGIIGGLGIGTAYVCPIATCVKWFPDKRGLISGLAVAGFGGGGLVFAPVAKSLILSVGVMNTFLCLGGIFFVIVMIGAQFMINPPAGYCPPGWTPPTATGAPGCAIGVDYTWREMVKTSRFWLLWITYFAGCSAGFLIIMNTVNIWQSFSILSLVPQFPTIPKDTYLDILTKGTTAVMAISVMNALGRILWGKISDSIGRKNTLYIMFLYGGVVMLSLNWLTSFPLFLFGVMSVGFCFGGFLGVYPALTADYFGTKNMGVNYGCMFMAYGMAGLFGPWIAPKLMKVVQEVPFESLVASVVSTKTYTAGNYIASFVIAGVMCLASIILVWIVKPPTEKKG
ncbi:MAG: OFA family MFS transporter [Deltaproteobacteria bacterium]|nr:OFA family MFS transporter [Deltaproteobacteria bacterium]